MNYDRSVPIETEDLRVFIERNGPVEVFDQHGSLVTYVSYGQLRVIDLARENAWTVADVELVLRDDMSTEIGAIPGNHIEEVGPAFLGFRVVVSSEAPDPGPTFTKWGV